MIIKLQKYNTIQYNTMRFVDLILLKPDEKWDLEYVASNPNITMDDAKLLNQRGLKVDLSRNVYLQIKDIIDNLEYKWDFVVVSDNLNMTVEIQERYSVFKWLNNPKCGNQLPLHLLIKHNIFTGQQLYNRLMYDNYSVDEVITALIDFYPDISRKSYYWGSLFANKNFTIPLMKKHIDKFKTIEYLDNSNINHFCRNSNINVDFLRYTLSAKNFWWEWNVDDVQRNPSITVQDMFNNPDLPWDGHWPDNDENENPILNANWWLNPNVTINDLIEHNKMEPEHWETVSFYTPIFCILENIQYPWNWDKVSSNPSLTVDVVVNNPQIKWNYQNISNNHMTYNEKYQLKQIKKLTTNNKLVIQPLTKIIESYI